MATLLLHLLIVYRSVAPQGIAVSRGTVSKVEPTDEDWAVLEGRVKEEEPDLRAEWEAWREELIQAYRLEGLVRG